MSVTAPLGWTASGVRAGTKPSGALDLALIVSDRTASVAGAFTTNKVVGAPIVVSKPRVASGETRAVLVSSGIANVATGEAGIEDAEEMIQLAAKELELDPAHVLVSATGVIGHRIPVERIRNALSGAVSALSRAGGEAAAQAILTTDAGPKTGIRTLTIDGTTVTIGAMAKGAGMIAPRMEPHATLLAFVTTDGQASAASLRSALGRALEPSFNSISVDGCMSTSDTVLVMANGAAGVSVADRPEFDEALTSLLQELAYAMVRDGEGASRVIRTRVTGAPDESTARAASREVGTSLLVRCAVAGGDPNWGRIAQALGQTPDLPLDPSRVSLEICGVQVAVNGAHTGREKDAAAAMSGASEVPITVDLGLGDASWEFLTSDLTTEYVTFNAEYTT